MKIRVCMVGIGLLFVSAAMAGNYTGEWEYQALNAGDTNFKVEHSGELIKFYRVMFPEYQGSRFKLEHVYRGKLSGKRIHGDLFVREEGMAEFEKLRPFDGQVLTADKLKMDDLPLERIGRSSAPPGPIATAPGEPKPKYDRVVIGKNARDEKPGKPPADEAAQKPGDRKPPAKADPEPEQLAKAAPVVIPTLIPVNRRMRTAAQKKADGLFKEGDAAYAAKKYARALEKYQAAFELNAGRVELLYKIGLGHGILGSASLRAGKKTQAAGHLKKAIAFWSKAVRLDPYNWGAKENIKRAERKLSALN
jgi:hypothetical protein